MFFITPLGTAAVLCCPLGRAAQLLRQVAPEPSREHRARPPRPRGRAGAPGGLTLRKAQRVYRLVCALWPVLQPFVIRALRGPLGGVATRGPKS